MYRVLLCDDETGIREGLAHFYPWESIGFTIAGMTESGRLALEFLKEHEDVDVLLTDILMVDGDGISLAAECRKPYPKIEIVFLTAYRKFEFAYSAVQMNVKYFILKPASFEEITETFSKIKAELDQKAGESKNLFPEAEASAEEKISRYIDDNLKTVSLKSVADMMNMNPYYFSSYFLKLFNENFSAFITRKKMKKGADYLIWTDILVKQISEELGYSHPRNFTRSFKRYYGIGPEEHRAKNRKE